MKKSALLLVLSLLSMTAFAQNFNSTFIQLTYGTQYDDYVLNNNTKSGEMFTLTADHVSSWKYGSNYFFVNSTFGEFTGWENMDKTGEKVRVYTEWSPSLSLSKVFGKESKSKFIKDVSLEYSVNAGSGGFGAMLGGVGLTFGAPEGGFLKLIAYYKDDTFNDGTYQITGVYDLPLWKQAGIRLQGYVDVSNPHNSEMDWGTDVLGQARVLWDVGQYTIYKDDKFNKLEIGLDWYVHRNNQYTTSVPQIAIRRTW